MFPLKDNLRCSTFPAVTLSLIVANCLVFVLELIQMNAGQLAFMQFVYKYALIPSNLIEAFSSGDPTAMGWTTFTVFSAMFMHGGIMHLLGNMMFLFVFGRAMEARMGRFGFLAFYLVTGVAASLIHIASDPTSTIPMLGASGAISGVLGGYLILWPKAKIKALVLPAFLVTISAYWFLIVWFGMQLVPVLFASGAGTGNLFMMGQLAPIIPAGGGVAYWAHIGGFVAGFIGAGLIRLIWPKTDVCYIPTDCDNDDTVDKGK